MEINLLQKVLNFVLHQNKLNYYLKRKEKLEFITLHDKILYIHHKLTIEVSLPQIINTKIPNKTASLIEYLFNILIEIFTVL